MTFFIDTMAIIVLSGRVRDLIEAAEPKTHQFIPLKLNESPRKILPTSDKRLYLLRCQSYVDCVDFEKSKVRHEFGSYKAITPNSTPPN